MPKTRTHLAASRLLLASMLLLTACGAQAAGPTDPPAAPERSHRNMTGPAGQNNNPEGSDMEKSAPAAVGRADRAFITKVAGNGLYELEAAKLASTRSDEVRIKGLAARMITEGSKARRGLEESSSKHNYPLPTKVPEDQQALINKLSQLKGKEFDQFFIAKVAIKDREEDIKLVQRASRATKTGDLKAWIDEHLPLMRARLETARDLAGQ